MNDMDIESREEEYEDIGFEQVMPVTNEED